ncbi:MAG: polysaccharide pyruvyl transferase family protein [Oscillospiraceae bacterium]|nr:polysaccharide pyruvyl transferase family protein [Oscillospiraceae bacterium]
MKIGIVTIMDYTNFGNRLQNYAVSHVLKDRFGCTAESLEAIAEQPFCNGNHVAWLKEQISRKCCIFPEFAEKKWGANITRWANFRNWSRKYIPTRDFHGSVSLPETLTREYDLFFAGSDQIWNYHFASVKFDNYFLRFAEHKKKAAISASFGVESIPDEWKQTYMEGLKDFAHLSVREEAGAKIVKDLTGRDVPVLIDPTMMLTREEWKAVARKPRADVSKPYVLKYYLGDDDGAIDRWAEENGYEIYPLLDPSRPELYSAGPGEFISLIENAALVCSDSFHCCVFSILFQRPFMVFARKGAENYMTSRIDTLLKTFHLEERWVHKAAPEDYLKCDYSGTGEILQRERDRFEAYIRDVLEAAHDC